jgi:hypothetical protein
MLLDFLRNRTAWLALGLVIGLVAAGMWSATPVQATASAQQSNMIIATGPIDGDGEAVIVLDGVTGEMKAWVMNTRAPRFFAMFTHNVLADFGLTGEDKTAPKFTMVTGAHTFQRNVGEFGNCVVYVAEVNSGKMCAYGMPWPRGVRNATARLSPAAFVPLDKVGFRDVAIMPAE